MSTITLEDARCLLTLYRLHNRDAKEYNSSLDMFSSLRPLHDPETNRPVGNFPRSMFAMHQMEGECPFAAPILHIAKYA